ncbi:unnamed protein product [Rhodiola kirilowii]
MITSPSNPALDYIDLIPSPGISTPSSICLMRFSL